MCIHIYIFVYIYIHIYASVYIYIYILYNDHDYEDYYKWFPIYIRIKCVSPLLSTDNLPWLGGCVI